jgi:hypothetical protein
MKQHRLLQIAIFLLICLSNSCETNKKEMKKIVFLHHSTGWSVWLGKTNRYIYKVNREGDVQKFFDSYNKKHQTNYQITEQSFPEVAPYGWKNYPYDYYNIWVKNAGEKPYLGEKTLEILTKEYDLIVFKHCFPVSNILPDTGTPDIESEEKRIENYKLQYDSLKNKMHEFPDKKFIIWTPAVHVKRMISEDEAKRTRKFYEWIINEWDVKGDNIFVWDFYKYETEGELYLLDKYSDGPDNSHPNREFSAKIAPLFSQFIINVMEGYIE